jgi:hypothetical protein
MAKPPTLISFNQLNKKSIEQKFNRIFLSIIEGIKVRSLIING